MFLWLISWVAVVLQLAFFLLSLGGSKKLDLGLSWPTAPVPLFPSLSSAAGLYYLAELIEEYSVLAKRVITSAVLVRPGAPLSSSGHNSTHSHEGLQVCLALD